MFHMYGKRAGCGPRGMMAVWGPSGRGGGLGGGFMMGHGRGLRGGGRDGNGGGRRGRMFDGGELKLVLLGLIGEAPRHGYDLIREIEERTGGAYAPSPGVIYPTLTLLDDMGLIEGVADGTKKQFAITDAGRAELDAKSAELKALMDRLADLGAQRAARWGTCVPCSPTGSRPKASRPKRCTISRRCSTRSRRKSSDSRFARCAQSPRDTLPPARR